MVINWIKGRAISPLDTRIIRMAEFMRSEGLESLTCEVPVEGKFQFRPHVNREGETCYGQGAIDFTFNTYIKAVIE